MWDFSFFPKQFKNTFFRFLLFTLNLVLRLAEREGRSVFSLRNFEIAVQGTSRRRQNNFGENRKFSFFKHFSSFHCLQAFETLSGFFSDFSLSETEGNLSFLWMVWNAFVSVATRYSQHNRMENKWKNIPMRMIVLMFRRFLLPRRFPFAFFSHPKSSTFSRNKHITQLMMMLSHRTTSKCCCVMWTLRRTVTHWRSWSDGLTNYSRRWRRDDHRDNKQKCQSILISLISPSPIPSYAALASVIRNFSQIHLNLSVSDTFLVITATILEIFFPNINFFLYF